MACSSTGRRRGWAVVFGNVGTRPLFHPAAVSIAATRHYLVAPVDVLPVHRGVLAVGKRPVPPLTATKKNWRMSWRS
jgi:hypothetical protein